MKNKFLLLSLVIVINLSLIKLPVYATNSDNNEIQPYMPVQNYDDDFLEAYQETVEFMEENSMFVDVSLETFEEEYKQSSFSSIDQFKDAKIEELEANPPETPTNVTKNNLQSAGANSRANGSGDNYFYDIGDTLSFQPNYDDYYIYETVQKGDIIYEDNAGWGYGHTAIVEGHFYSKQYGYYVRTIEAAKWYDVCYGVFDAPRVEPRILSLYRVDDATAYQRALAVQFCKNQIGEDYDLGERASHIYADSNDKWICSQLVWAGYKNQGIDIESEIFIESEDGVYPREIALKSEFVSEVNFKTRQTAVSGKFKNSFSDTAVFVDEGDNDTSLQVRYGNRDVCDQEWLSAVNGFVYSRIVDVVAGDFNGDGYDDIMVIYNYNSSTTSMYLWVGSSSGLSYSCKPWEGTSFPSSGILDVVVGDFYGDTKEDIAIVYQHAGSTTSIFLWRGTSTLPVLTGIHSNGSIWTSTTFSGVNIRQIVSGKFSSTSKSDLVLLYDYGGTTTALFEWRGATSSFNLINNINGSVWRSESFNPDCVVELVVGNFTGTSYDDLTIIYDYRNRATAFFEWKGTSAGLTKVSSTVWSSSKFEASRMASRITSGDYNGDGYCDIAGFYDLDNADTKLFYWKGSSSGFTTANSSGSWYSGTFDATCISGDVVSGNHNNSAYDDINVVFSTDNIWLFEWRGSSSGLYFNSTIGTGILMW